jgi:hypothetical protein
MNTSLPSGISTRLSHQAALSVCCLLFLFAFARPAQGGFTQGLGTNVYSLYAYDGTSFTVYGTDPDPLGPFGGGALPYPTFFFGTGTGTVPPTGPVTVTAVGVPASATFTLGNNPTGVGGITLALNNPNTVPDEVRLDWCTFYINSSGSSIPIPGFLANVSGTMTGVGSYWELAGGETIFYNSSTYTASTASIGGVPYLFGPAGAGPWIGAAGPGAFSTTTATMSFAPVPVIANGSTFSVVGYLDLIVDPGTVQVQILPLVAPPALGICTYSNSPVVFYPSDPGTNFALYMTTNLTTGTWVPVTNGIPFTAVQITNPPNPVFFRLQ